MKKKVISLFFFHLNVDVFVSVLLKASNVSGSKPCNLSGLHCSADKMKRQRFVPCSDALSYKEQTGWNSPRQ